MERDLGRAAAWVALGAFALALAAGATQRVGGWDSAADFYAMYAPGAEALRAGRPWVEPRSGPGYPALLALLGSLGLELFTAAKLVAACSAAAVLWFSFQAFRSLAGERAAFVAELLLAPVVLRYGFVAGNDLVCAAWASASLACLLRREAPRAAALALAGLLAGLAFATRYPAAALPVASALALALFLPPGSAWATRAKRSAAYLAGLALVVLPWLALNLRWHGKLLPQRTHALIALEVHGDPARRLDMRALEAMEERFPSLAAVVAEDPARFAAHFALDFHEDLARLLADLLALPALLFVGPGLLLFALGRGRRGLVLLAWAAGGFALAALAPYQARYHLAILPVFALAAALGLELAGGGGAAAGAGAPRARLARLALALSLCVLGASSALRASRELRADPVEVLAAAAVLRERAEPGELVVARKPHLPVRGGLGLEPAWTTLELEPFLERLQKTPHARWLYVGPEELRANPALAPLARGEGAPEWLELAHRNEAPQATLWRVR